jgi:hypothetical protein
MRCTKCGSDNAAEARFCNQCATPLNRACPQCAHRNAPGAKFCAQCAAALAGHAASAPASPPQSASTAPHVRVLAAIYNWFTEGFDTPDLIDAKALLNKLGAQQPSIQLIRNRHAARLLRLKN